ncbi:MAG: SIS domain-containing protein [Anaerolineaceae bacterium]|nr:SIS domain-containing protein [Anaerolineaceae bacterium]
MKNEEQAKVEKFPRRDQHPYYIWDSIMVVPEILKSCLSDEVFSQVKNVFEKMKQKEIDNIILLGTESSFFVSLSLRYIFKKYTGIPTQSFLTTEFSQYPPLTLNNHSAVFFHSHSGTTLGDLEAIDVVRKFGGYSVGVTNIPESVLAKNTDDVIIGPGGAKAALPATRAYTAALFRMAMLAVELGKFRAVDSDVQELEKYLNKMPDILDVVSKSFAEKSPGIIDVIKDSSAFILIGSGPNNATAEEATLSFYQSTGLSAKAYKLENYLHGPIQALQPQMCVILIAAPGPFQKRMIDTAKACKVIGAKVVLLVPEGFKADFKVDVLMEFPSDIPELLTPMVYITPLWQIAYYFSLLGTTDVHTDRLSMDKPEFKKAMSILMTGDKKFVKE